MPCLNSHILSAIRSKSAKEAVEIPAQSVPLFKAVKGLKDSILDKGGE